MTKSCVTISTTIVKNRKCVQNSLCLFVLFISFRVCNQKFFSLVEVGISLPSAQWDLTFEWFLVKKIDCRGITGHYIENYWEYYWESHRQLHTNITAICNFLALLLKCIIASNIYAVLKYGLFVGSITARI